MSGGTILGAQFFNSCKKEENTPTLRINSFSDKSNKHNSPYNSSAIYMVVSDAFIKESNKFKLKYGTGYIINFELIRTFKKQINKFLTSTNSEFEKARSKTFIQKKSSVLKEAISLVYNGHTYEIKNYTKKRIIIELPCDKNGGIVSDLNIKLLSREQFDNIFPVQVKKLIL